MLPFTLFREVSSSRFYKLMKIPAQPYTAHFQVDTFAVGRKIKLVVIPLAEGDNITMYQLAAFGRSRRAGSVEHDEQRLRLW